MMNLSHATGWTSKEKALLAVMLLWPLAMMCVYVVLV